MQYKTRFKKMRSNPA